MRNVDERVYWVSYSGDPQYKAYVVYGPRDRWPMLGPMALSSTLQPKLQGLGSGPAAKGLGNRLDFKADSG